MKITSTPSMGSGRIVAEIRAGEPRKELIDAYCLQPTRKEVINALHESAQAWASEAFLESGAMWSIRCHYEAIRLLQGMKEAV